jgi:hypothetical protein
MTFLIMGILGITSCFMGHYCCLCINYHASNKITMKNNYPVPQIDDLLDWLNRAKYFSQIDLKLKYYQTHIT